MVSSDVGRLNLARCVWKPGSEATKEQARRQEHQPTQDLASGRSAITMKSGGCDLSDTVIANLPAEMSKRGTSMDDGQFGFEIEFDEKTQAWLEWSAPERMEAEVRAFLAETVPGIVDYDTDPWWQPPLSTRVIEAARQLFGSWEAFLAPENFSRADQFIRFVGEAIIRAHPGMVWTKTERRYKPLYQDFHPDVHFVDGFAEDPMGLIEMLFVTESAETVDIGIRDADKSA